VAVGVDALDQAGILAGDPPQDEERAAGLAPGQQVKYARRRALHTGLKRVPTGGVGPTLDLGGMKVVLDVDGNGV